MRARAWVPIVLGLTLALGAVPARADAACAWDGAGHVITVTTTGGFVNIERDGGAIEVNGSLCWGPGLTFATLNATRRIVVNGGDGDDNVTIMLREGRFAPGFGDEPGGSDEVEFRLNLGGGHNELGIWGTAGNDRIRYGSKGGDVLVNLNAAEATGLDADVRASGLALVYVMGWLGDDVISAAGGRATGAVLPLPISMQGAEGDDLLTGGAAADELGDELEGGDRDTLRGRGGADHLRVNDADGTDVIRPGNGIDVCAFDAGDVIDSCEGTEL